ncbi:MAG: MmcQ/YjbR family DNA-binding protein [Ruminococcus sp.]|nr:MmcQ/YjbR family DNA-binding protein [Ruminococcus sp.]
MNCDELRAYIDHAYNAKAEFLWSKSPNSMIFRHSNNRKWFAAVLKVEKTKLGLSESGIIYVLNVKCDPIMIGSFVHEPGFFPAYHMNKENWISILLGDSTNDEKIRMLLDVSYELTSKKHKKKSV